MNDLNERLDLLDFWCEEMFRALADTDPEFRSRFFDNIRGHIRELRDELNDVSAAKRIEGYLVRLENIPDRNV